MPVAPWWVPLDEHAALVSAGFANIVARHFPAQQRVKREWPSQRAAALAAARAPHLSARARFPR
eukprot:10325210-Lingulodinium_polyedra.AAC.1